MSSSLNKNASSYNLHIYEYNFNLHIYEYNFNLHIYEYILI